MNRQFFSMIVAAGIGCLLGSQAFGFEITNNQQIDGASPQIVGEDASVAGDNTIAPSGASPNWTYTWADRDGDDSSNAVATAGLNLGIYKLYANSTATRGTITLDLSKDDTNGNIEGTDTLAIRTNRGLPTSNNQDAHHLTIQNVGDIDMGGVDTSGNTYHGGYYSGSDAYGGNISIGSEGNRAGAVRVDYIYARRYDDSTRPGGPGSPGSIAVYSDDNVLIKDSADDPGDIRTDSCAGTGGSVTINHIGDLLFSRIYTYVGLPGVNYTRAGNVTLNGGDSSGDLQGSDIFANNLRTGGYDTTGSRPSITISHYGNVTISNTIDSSTASTSIRYLGGNLTIDNVTNITIGGSINLRSAERFSDSGVLSLTCTGMITLAELDMDKVLRASLSSGSGTNVLTGELLNFDTTGTGSGSDTNNPVETTQTALRVAPNQLLLYDVAANPLLGGKVYQVADLSGTANAGGFLIRDDFEAATGYPPIIATDPASEIKHTSAMLNGTLSSTGSAETVVSVYWCSDGDKLYDTNAWTTAANGGSYTFAAQTDAVPPSALYDHTASVLPQDTTFTYRYRAENSGGVVWGYAEDFLTLLEPLATVSVSDETFHSAKLTGDITQGNPNPTAYFCVNKTTDPGDTSTTNEWDFVVAMGTKSGSFTYTLGGLEGGTNYHARVYVVNDATNNWSGVQSFSTDARPTIPNDLTLSGNCTVYNSLAFNETAATLAPVGSEPPRIYDFSSFNTNHASLGLGSYYIRHNPSDDRTYLIQLNLNGGDLTATTGYIATWADRYDTGNIELYNVGNIAMGDGYLSTHDTSTGYSGTGNGDVRIGETDAPAAGDIQVATIETYRKVDYDSGGGSAGDILVRGAGDILIQNAAEVVGDLFAGASEMVAIGQNVRVSSDIEILHKGSLRAAAVKNVRWDYTDNTTVKKVNFNGWWPAGGAVDAKDAGTPTGTFEAEQMLAPALLKNGMTKNLKAPDVDIRNYATVSVSGDIVVYTGSLGTGNSTGYGGDVTITDIVGDITFGGDIDASAGTTAKSGILSLQAGGKITFAGLDLSKIRYAVIQPGAEAVVTGLLTGTDGNALVGDGEGTLSNAGTAMLRVPAGKDLIYYMDQNPDLQGGEYTLADENGTPDVGGTLKPYRPKGTLLILK